MDSSLFSNSTAEYSVIGDLLIDSRCLPNILEVLPKSDFFSIAPCRKVYAAVLRMNEAGQTIDPVTIERATDVGRQFLVDCMDLTPTVVNAADHAAAVLDGFRRRQAAETAQKLMDAVQSKGTSAADAVSAACAELEAIEAASAENTVHSSADSMKNFLAYRGKIQSGEVAAFECGLPHIDAILGGFTPGDMYIIGARTSVGKTAFAVALADMLAKTVPVLYVSLEMTENELTARRISAAGKSLTTYSHLLFSPSHSDDEDADLCNTAAKLSGRMFSTFVPREKTNVAEIAVRAQSVHAAVIVVDYLGLLDSSNPRASEYERISEISLSLKRLAKRLNCVVLALSQANRECEANGKNNPPEISNLRGSGQLEQDATGILMLHRPDLSAPEPDRKPGEPLEFDVLIKKNRHGRTGLVKLDWHPAVNRFVDGDAKSWI